jgi:ribosome-associated heat shock protein Hsp15
MSEPDADQAAQRIDKWLWHARFARTRGAAQRLALSGHVRVNRDKVSAASRLVRVGDVLTLALGRGVRVIRISGIAERRGSFEEAQRLYADQERRSEDGTSVPAPVE